MPHFLSHTDLFNNSVNPRSLFLLAGGAMAVGGGALLYVAMQNSAALDERFNILDNSRTAIFNSVADCTAQRFSTEACVASQDEALRIAGQLGTTLSYRNGRTCRQKHSACNAEYHPDSTNHYDSDGNFLYSTDSSYYTYEPDILAWQALRDDLTVSVPLYRGPDDSVLVRKDGQKFVTDGTSFSSVPR